MYLISLSARAVCHVCCIYILHSFARILSFRVCFHRASRFCHHIKSHHYIFLMLFLVHLSIKNGGKEVFHVFTAETKCVKSVTEKSNQLIFEMSVIPAIFCFVCFQAASILLYLENDIRYTIRRRIFHVAET